MNESISQSPKQEVSLTPEQQAYINKHWSWGAALLGPLVYFLANYRIKEGLLSLIPFYNIYSYIKAIYSGRRMAWATGRWASFEEYQRRQRLLGKIGGICVGVVLAFISLSIVLVFFLTKAPVEASRNFLHDISSGNSKKAYSETSANFKKVGSLTDFQNYVSDHPILLNIQDITFTSREIRSSGGPSFAKIQGYILSEKGDKVWVEIGLIKMSDTWRVDSFEIFDEDLVDSLTNSDL